MSLFGGGPTAPKPQPAPAAPPPPPDRSSEEVAAQADRQRKRFFAKQKGRASTILTGNLGVTDSPSGAAARLGGVGV